MDRRTVLAVVLSVAIYYGWIILRGPQLEEATDGATDAVTDAGEPAAPAAPKPVVSTEPAPEAPPTPLPSDVPIEPTPFEACGARGVIDPVGGLRSMILLDHQGPYDVQPLYSWVWGRINGSVEGPWLPWGVGEPGPAEMLTDHARGLSVGSGTDPSTSPPVRMSVVENRPGAVTLHGWTDDGIEVTEKLAEGEHEGQCVIDVEVTWSNPSPNAYAGNLWLGVHEVASHGAGGMAARYSSQRQPTAVTDGSLHYGGPNGAGCVRAGTRLEDDERHFDLEGPVSWFGISDRYFGMYVLPEDPEAGVASMSRLGSGEQALDGVHVTLAGGLQAGGSRTERYMAYIGPNDMDILALVSDDLTRVVDLGWFAFFGYPLLYLLRIFHAGVGNWGWAIVMLTLTVKLVFFPMTQRSFKSMQRMQKIQPELNRIREELADNPQEMNRRVFEVMQEHKVNPAAGCLPMLVQMPVWVALYNVLLTSVDLYHTEFLYLRDLTQPDPYLVLPITIMVLMFVQQQFNAPANMDPAQQQVMKLMPLFFGLMFFAFPSGLAVYVFMNMVLSNLQQWLIKRGMDSGDGDSPQPAAAAS